MALALSASTVKSWFQYRCERKTRYEMMTGAERDAVPILRDIREAPWAQLGDEFEKRLVNRLAESAAVLRPAPGDEYLSQAQSVAFLKGECAESYAHQLILDPSDKLRRLLSLPDEVQIRRCYVDLVYAWDGAEGTELQPIDIKATQRATPFHKAQVAFYALMLETLP